MTVLDRGASPCTPARRAAMKRLLRTRFTDLLSRLDETANWSLVLSGGEQQRLAIGRALLYRPDWLFLDEATSALDQAAEQRILSELRQRLPDATFISITHRRVSTGWAGKFLAIDPASRGVKTEAFAGQ